MTRSDPQRRAQGFFGKLPARGDFVGSGLKPGFLGPWDRWMAASLAAARDRLGAGWTQAWFSAPVWCFALPAGQCGPEAALGLFLPSVDRVGRPYPLSFARLAPELGLLAGDGADWLARAEAAGRAALDRDLDPDGVRALLDQPAPAEPAPDPSRQAPPDDASPDRTPKNPLPMSHVPSGEAPLARSFSTLGTAGLWWTEGAPLVRPTRRMFAGLPDPADFAAMLDDRLLAQPAP